MLSNGCVSACGPKRDVWVGEVSGWIKRGGKVGVALVATLLRLISAYRKGKNVTRA